MDFYKNNIEYERDVDHCETSQYVKMITIKKITPAENLDTLDRIEFEELGWNTLSKKGLNKVGDKVMFIPAESVLPIELSEELGITKYLSSGRVRVTRFKGNRSEGVIAGEEVNKWIPYIMKWEDKPTIAMRGDELSLTEIPSCFEKFYKMPNILNESYTFEVGEKIYYSEKIHGTNTRFGIFKHPEKLEKTLYVGSHNVVLKESDSNIYWKIIKKIKNIIVDDIEYFGEIFGPGVQDLHYDRKYPAIIIFAAIRNGFYMTVPQLKVLCDSTNLPLIDFEFTKFESIEQLRELAGKPSKYSNSHMREGIVIVSADRPYRMAKCMNFEYLTRKKGKERH